MIQSRYNDTSGIQCQQCGWEGQVCDCKHSYYRDFQHEATPMDFCPACGSDQLTPIEEETK